MSLHEGRFQLRAEISHLDDFDALASWHDWLASDPDLVDTRVTTQQCHQAAGEMAGWFDVAVAVTNQATALGNLVLAYLTWRSTRPTENAQRMTVVIQEGDRRITINNMSDSEVHSILGNRERQNGD